MSIEKIHNSLWAERFRPTNLKEYIGNEEVKTKVQRDLDKGDISHLFLYGPPGTGKTSLAKIIAKTLDADVLYINAADENNVEVMRGRIKDFASSMGFKQWKIVILDEASHIPAQSQVILLNIVETFSANCRFILTGNYVEKIIPALRSRCTCYQITPPSKGEVAKRIVEIMTTESIKYTKEDLAKIITANYPDIRSIINVCQDNIINSELKIHGDSIRENDYCGKILEELKSSEDRKTKFIECRKIIANSKVRSFDELYTYLYKNINEFEIAKQGDLIIDIAESQFQDSFVVDKEIGIMSLLIKLIRII